MKLCEDRARRALKRVAKCEFGLCAGDPLRGSRASSAQTCGETSSASLLEEVLYETLVLETWRNSRTKRSFWRLWRFAFGGRLVRTLVLETWRFTLRRKSRTKRSFWRLGASLLEEVSYETLVLGAWRFTFGGNLVRNDLFWGLGASLLELDSEVASL